MTGWELAAAGGMACGAAMVTLGLIGITAHRLRARLDRRHTTDRDDWTAVADAAGVTGQARPATVRVIDVAGDEIDVWHHGISVGGAWRTRPSRWEINVYGRTAVARTRHQARHTCAELVCQYTADRCGLSRRRPDRADVLDLDDVRRRPR